MEQFPGGVESTGKIFLSYFVLVLIFFLLYQFYDIIIGQVGAWTALPSSYSVEVMDENDMVNAVKFAKEFNLRLVVKGTGISFMA